MRFMAELENRIQRVTTEVFSFQKVTQSNVFSQRI